MRRPTLLRLRRFGNREAIARLLAGSDLGAVSGGFAAVQELLDAAHGPFSSPLVPELRHRGWDAHDLILGVDAVRRAWEAEHGPIPTVPGIADPDVLLALAEARRLQPDVVLDSNLNVLDRAGRTAIRRAVPSVRVLAGYMGTEKRFHRAIALDLVLVPCHSMADAIRPFARGDVEVLPHSFDHRILDGLPPRTIEHPLVFAGALGPRYVERHRVLMALLERTDLEAWIGLRKGVRRSPDGWLIADSPENAGAAAHRSLRGRLRDLIPTGLLARSVLHSERAGAIFNARIAGRTGGAIVTGAPMRDPAAAYPDRCHPAVGGTDYLTLLRRSGVVVHRGIDALGGCGGALRLFEVTGVGAALLVEDSPTVRELFDVDREVVVYSGPDDAVERARWLTAEPEAREAIARAGQERTLRDHTAAARARVLGPLLERALDRAPDRGLGGPRA